MAKINVLDISVANLIAAGEVVDRPASVLKELLENAVDAGATEITAEIRRGGVALIRVSDNGCGIAPEDLPIALKRHATSKIRSAEDLAQIGTLGFRGEALAAISAVSHVTILSKTREAPSGTMLSSMDGEITEVCEVGCADGTTVMVEELFSSVPARRKFLKKDATEALAACGLVEKVALSRPDISFRMIVDGNLKFATAGDGRVQDALYAIYGREVATRLLPVDAKVGGVSVRGFIGRSDNVKNSRNLQNAFINGRYVRSKTVSAALERAFTSYIAPDKFPICALYLSMDAGVVDVNVHPAKLEVKFSDEHSVFEAVYYGVREALEKAAYRPEITVSKKDLTKSFLPIGAEKAEQTGFSPEFLQEKAAPTSGAGAYRPAVENTYQRTPTAPAENAYRKAPFSPLVPRENTYQGPFESREFPPAKESPEAPKTPFSGGFRSSIPAEHTPPADSPMALRQQAAFSPDTPPASPEQEQLTAPPTDAGEVADFSPSSVSAPKAEVPAEEETVLPPYRILGCAFQTYILVEVEDSLLLIDQHAAHERLIFEEIKRKRDLRVTPQPLLVPLSLSLPAEERGAAEENRAALEAAGFSFTLTEKGCLISSVPDEISAFEAEGLFARMLSDLLEGGEAPALSEQMRREKLLYQVACKAAVKGGRNIGEEQRASLVEKLLRLPDITVCPHGRPVAIKLTHKELDRLFERA